jgi:hypothetical protein
LPKRASSRTRYDGLGFPLEEVYLAKADDQTVRLMAPGSFQKYAASRGLTGKTTAEWLAIEWYVYELETFQSCLSYDERVKWFNSTKFIASNAAPSAKEVKACRAMDVAV